MTTTDRDQRIMEEHHEIAGGRIAEAARDTTSDPTAPTTPGEALRWARDRLDYQAWADPTGQWSAPQAEAGRAQKRLMLERLRRWADQLDIATPTTYAQPAEPPPDVTELWDAYGNKS